MPAGAEAGSLALNTGTDILTYRVPRAELTVPERQDIILMCPGLRRRQRGPACRGGKHDHIRRNHVGSHERNGA